MRTLLRSIVRVLCVVVWSSLGCAHAPPVTGDRAADAAPNIEYPEANCGVNNSVDCRPVGGP